MGPGSQLARVKIPFYEENIKTDNDLKIKPPWIKNENGFMFLNKGIHNISFSYKYSDDRELCNMKVIILGKFFFNENCRKNLRHQKFLEGESPREVYCPPSQKFEVDSFYSLIRADWNEPEFSDNVKVVNLTSNVSKN